MSEKAKENFIRYVLPILISGVIGVAGGGGGTYWMHSYDKNATIIKINSKIDVIQNKLNDLDRNKVDWRSLDRVNNNLISIRVDLCKLLSTNNPSAEADCERLRSELSR